MEATKRPRDVKNTRDFLHMESDNTMPNTFGWSILHNGTDISLHAPGGGYVEIPTKQFNEIVDWYMKPQPYSRRSFKPKAAPTAKGEDDGTAG